MKSLRILGAVLFLTGLLIFFFGSGGHVQFVTHTDAGPSFIWALASALIVLPICGALMIKNEKSLDSAALTFMAAGTFVFVWSSFAGLNVALDTSDPEIYELWVNNTDVSHSPRYGPRYFALVQSWWDPTRYIPLRVNAALYKHIKPGTTALEVGIRQGAFGYRYFSRVAIADGQGDAALGRYAE